MHVHLHMHTYRTPPWGMVILRFVSSQKPFTNRRARTELLPAHSQTLFRPPIESPAARPHGVNRLLVLGQPFVNMRGWRNTAEIVLSEISNSMKPYPLWFTHIPVTWSLWHVFVEPQQFDEVSDCILPTSHHSEPNASCYYYHIIVIAVSIYQLIASCYY